MTVSARGPDGESLTAAELGFEGVFNYCDAAGSPSCTGDDLPTWDPATATLTGNAEATDTSGASGWFQPTVPVKTLTFTFRWRSGFPVYQTWFASLARDISGTVTGPGDSASGVTMKLFGPDGSLLATTSTAEDGTYSFPGYTAADGYRVEVDPPDGYTMDESAGEAGQREREADLGTADATDVDFALREIIPVQVSGTVTDTDGNPIPGVPITMIDDDTGDELTVVTDSDGYYEFDRVEPGSYTWELDVHDGYSVQTEPEPLTVPPGSEDPISDQDFVLDPQPSLSGTVTAGGAPVGNVVVRITGPDGFEATAMTSGDGTYEFDRLPPGDYTVTVEPPDGYVVDGDESQTVVVAGDDVTGVDFQLIRQGAIGGQVTDEDGDSVPGVTIEVTGPDGSVTALLTDGDGNCYLGELGPGDYTVAITAPDGHSVVGAGTRQATITPAGENILDLDFVLTVEDEPTQPPGGPGEPGETGPPAPQQPQAKELPATGTGGVLAAAGLGVVLVAGGALLVRRRSG